MPKGLSHEEIAQRLVENAALEGAADTLAK